MSEMIAQKQAETVQSSSDGLPARLHERVSCGKVIELRPPAGKAAAPHVTAIIPARGGSRGVPRKNAKLLAGKPLVAYSIEAALKCPAITQVIVSSDDDEILSIASSYAPEIAWRRPAELSHDTADMGAVVRHVSARLVARGIRPDVTVVLHPTSPFRNPRLMDLLVGKALDGHSRVISARRIPAGRPGYYFQDGQGLARLDPAGRELPFFKAHGLFSAVNSAPFLPEYLHIIDDEIQLVDIDYPHQFQLAEEIVRSGHFDFDLS